ncbi:MAG: hypothetical protein ACRCS3_02560, partial [Paracoccaceae bacterium]
DKVVANTTLSPLYRELAILRRVIVAGADSPIADRRAALESIASPGQPYRVLAQEQLAMLAVEEGQIDTAITLLTALISDQEASAGLRERAAQMIVALGGTLPETEAG